MLSPQDYCPKTLEEAIDLIVANLEPSEIDYIQTEGAVAAHHGFGRAIRNAWLWDANHPLSKHFRERFGLGMADDMSGLILAGVEAAVKDDAGWDPAPDVERYKKHWRDMNIDPLTQKETARFPGDPHIAEKAKPFWKFW